MASPVHIGHTIRHGYIIRDGQILVVFSSLHWTLFKRIDFEDMRFRLFAVCHIPFFFYDWNLTTAPFKSGSSWLFFFAYFDGWSVTRPLHYSKCSIDPSFYPWRSSRRMWWRWSIFSRVCMCVMVDKRERRPLDTHTLRIIIGYTHSTKREHCQIDYPPPPQLISAQKEEAKREGWGILSA